jgi:hypothetical protein
MVHGGEDPLFTDKQALTGLARISALGHSRACTRSDAGGFVERSPLAPEDHLLVNLIAHAMTKQ